MQRNFAELHKALGTRAILRDNGSPFPALQPYVSDGVGWPPVQQRSQTPPQCLCQKRRKQRRTLVNLRLVEFLKEDLPGGSHSSGCPLHFPANSQTSYLIRVNSWKLLFRNTIEAAMIWQSAYASNSIGMQLSIRSFMNPQSPALKFLYKCWYRVLVLGQDIQPEPILRELQRYYSDGKASPLDVDEFGRNALFVSVIPGTNVVQC